MHSSDISTATSERPSLSTSDLYFSYHPSRTPTQWTIDHCHLSLEGSGHIGIIGGNGSGKTTLFKLLIRALRPQHGEMRVNGRALAEYSQRQLARHIAFVPQDTPILFPLRAWDVVMMGRAPYHSRFAGDTPEDSSAVEASMRFTETLDFAKRSLDELSGGERQRIFLARAICQDTPILLLDEPANHLDIHYQWKLLEWIATLTSTQGKLILSTLHHLDHARTCNHVMLWKSGQPVAYGDPLALLEKERLTELFAR